MTKRTRLNNYYLEMDEHVLTVPYYNEERRIRVLIRKNGPLTQYSTCTMGKMSSTVRSRSLAIPGKLSRRLRPTKIYPR